MTTGIVAGGAGVIIAAERIAVGRRRLRPDPAAGEPLGKVRGRPVTVIADDGVPLHAEVSGPDDAPATVVFCHGYTLNQDVWHYQRLALAEDLRVVCWDQRSHGRSGRSDPDRVGIDQLGADLAVVLAATVPGSMPAVLVGHSMGGMTIMALAAQRPELFATKVIGTVLISTTDHLVDATTWVPIPLRPVARLATPTLLRGSSRGRRAALIERLRGVGGDLAFLSTRFIAFGNPDVSPTVVDFLERVIRATPIDVVADFYLALLDHDKRGALEILGRVPTLVIAGEQDRLTPARQAADMAAAIPGATLVRLPRTGHMVIMEQPEAVTELIADLVAVAIDRDLTGRPA